MKAVLRLFVDDLWLAGAGLFCAGLCLVLRWSGMPREAVGCLFLMGLVGALGFSVWRAVGGRARK